MNLLRQSSISFANWILRNADTDENPKEERIVHCWLYQGTYMNSEELYEEYLKDILKEDK